MSDMEKTVQGAPGNSQDCSEEEVPKTAPELCEAVDVSYVMKGFLKSAPEERKRMAAALERMRQDMEDVFNISDNIFTYERPARAKRISPAAEGGTEKQEDVKNRAVQTASVMRDQNSEASKNEVSVAFPGALEQMLYEAFVGGEYKGKPMVDMLGFTEKEHQALKDWESTKKALLNALSGDQEFVAYNLCKVGANVYDENKNNSTALMLACSYGNLSIVNMLLMAGAKVNDTNLNERNALMEAAEGGYLNVVKLLVESGADVGKQDNKGDTALTIARRQGHSEVAEFLESIISSEDSEQKGSDDIAAHCVAVPKTDERSSELLVHSSASKDSFLSSADNAPGSLSIENSSGSSKQGVSQILSKLCEAVNMPCVKEGPKKLEKRLGGGEILERMRQIVEDAFEISEKIDIYCRPEEAKQISPAEGGGTEMREDLENRVVPTASVMNDPNSEVSENEVNEDFPGAVERMLYETFAGGEYKGKSMVDIFGFTEKEQQELKEWKSTKKAFLKALSGDQDLVRATISKVGANVYDVNQNNSTALMLACSYGNVGIVNLLLKAGARLNETNLCQRNALMEAAEGGYLDVVKLLVKYGADLNKRDDKGDTALTFAHRQGHSHVAEFLQSVISSEDSEQKRSDNIAAHCVDVPKTDERSSELPVHSSASKDRFLPFADDTPDSLSLENSSGSGDQVVPDISS